MYRLAPALMALVLTACAATPYQASDPHGYGYQEQQLTAELYDVMFVANTATDAAQVEDLALLHAAELGAARGYAYLAVMDRKAGVIMLAGRSGPAQPNFQSTMPSGRDAGMTMSMGMGRSGAGGYGNTNPYMNSSSGGGNPARACVLRVRFYKQGEAASASSTQDIQVLLTRLRGEYGVSATH